MRIPEKLFFEGKEVATLKGFTYETPWASAQPEFTDNSIPTKLASLSKFRAYDRELEDLELAKEEEEALWENKLSELGLTHSDLKLDKDGPWSVTFSDGSIGQVYSLSLYNGVLQWRAENHT